MKRPSALSLITSTTRCQRHQRGTLRSLSTTRPTHAKESSPESSRAERPSLPRLNLDPSTSSLLHDLHLGTGSGQDDKTQIGNSRGRRRYQRPLIMDEKELEALNEERRTDGDDWIVTQPEDLHSEDTAQPSAHRLSDESPDTNTRSSSPRESREDDHDMDSYVREERRSPAAVFGSKRIGSVVLPDPLLDAIQREIDGNEDKKLLRQAYLAQQSAKSSTSGSPQHLSSSLQSHLNQEKEESSFGRRKSAVTPLSALVSAAVDLPTQYAVVRNVVREVEKRIGTDEWRRLGLGVAAGEGGKQAGVDGRRGVIVWDSGVGSALWAVTDSYTLLSPEASQEPPSEGSASVLPIDYIQGSRHMLEMTRNLFDEVAKEAEVRYQRVDKQLATPNVAISTFQLSKLPTKKARLNRIQEMWDTGAEIMIVIDRGDKEGYQAIMETRDELLRLGRTTSVTESTLNSTPVGEMTVEDEQTGEVRPLSKKERQRLKKDARAAKKQAKSKGARVASSRTENGKEVVEIGGETFYEVTESGYPEGEETVDVPREEAALVGSHVIAPCPHDGACPLATTRDICRFSQRLQTPAFFRKTKHSGQGVADLKYSYVVIRRGHRPSKVLQEIGRLGAIAKEEIAAFDRKSSAEAQQLIVPLIGGKEGDYEMVTVQGEGKDLETPRTWADDDLSHSEIQDALRSQAYQWPRLVYPPLKRSGHVVMDTCHPSGSIVRLTVAKSDTKQVYHDARKSSWGDLFPHRPRATERVRTRGIKKLNKMTPLDDDFAEDLDDNSQEIDLNAVLLEASSEQNEPEGVDLVEENKIVEQYLRELPAAEWVEMEEQRKADRSDR